jgi:hypothetical protein
MSAPTRPLGRMTLAFLTATLLLVALAAPARGHVTSSFDHLWNDHILPLVQSTDATVNQASASAAGAYAVGKFQDAAVDLPSPPAELTILSMNLPAGKEETIQEEVRKEQVDLERQRAERRS